MKKIIGIALIAVAAITAGWNFSQNQKEVELSDLALANVEALAQNESVPSECSATQEKKCCRKNNICHTYHTASGGNGWITSTCTTHKY